VEVQVYTMNVGSGRNEVLRRIDDTPPLRERIFEQLELLIISGSLAPGARLVEGELADTLGVSRGPIREALQLLWADGFVDLRPRQGAFVHVPTRKEIDDFFDIRRALERESVRLATVRITTAGARRLREVLDRARELLDQGDDPSSVHRHVRIHREITDIADNDVLTKMLGDLEKRSSWYRAPFSPVVRRRAWDEHEVIVNAIVEGDVEEAMSAILLHTDKVRENLYAAIGSGHELTEPAMAENERPRRGREAGGEGH
jgi:DNA-binding GntR family transcriptional regulator